MGAAFQRDQVEALSQDELVWLPLMDTMHLV